MFLLLAIVLVFGVNSLVNAQEEIKLKAANYLPVTHPMSVLSGWSSDEIKKRTNGKVEITYHAGGTLLNPVKMYDGVLTGISDLGFSHIDYTRGRFPVMEVFDLPLGFPSGWVSTQVATDFFNKYNPGEWKDVHILYVTPFGPLILQTVAKPVKNIEDLKGMKIRAVGVMSDVIKALGGLPVPLQMPDVYDALTSRRFYKEAFPHAKAMQIISGLKGTHFDPEVVDAFAALEEQFNRIREEKLRHEKKVLPAGSVCMQRFQPAAAAG